MTSTRPGLLRLRSAVSRAGATLRRKSSAHSTPAAATRQPSGYDGSRDEHRCHARHRPAARTRAQAPSIPQRARPSRTRRARSPIRAGRESAAGRCAGDAPARSIGNASATRRSGDGCRRRHELEHCRPAAGRETRSGHEREHSGERRRDAADQRDLQQQERGEVEAAVHVPSPGALPATVRALHFAIEARRPQYRQRPGALPSGERMMRSGAMYAPRARRRASRFCVAPRPEIAPAILSLRRHDLE